MLSYLAMGVVLGLWGWFAYLGVCGLRYRHRRRQTQREMDALTRHPPPAPVLSFPCEAEADTSSLMDDSPRYQRRVH